MAREPVGKRAARGLPVLEAQVCPGQQGEVLGAPLRGNSTFRELHRVVRPTQLP